MKQFKNQKLILIGVVCAAAIGLTTFACQQVQHHHQQAVLAKQTQQPYYYTHFLPGTRIGSVAVGRLSLPEAVSRLTNQSYTFSGSGFASFSPKVAPLTRAQSRKLQVPLYQLLRRQHAHLALNFALAPASAQLVATTIIQNGAADLNRALLKINARRTPTVPGNVVKTASQFKLVSSRQGNTFGQLLVLKAWRRAIRQGKTTVSLGTAQELQLGSRHDYQLAKQQANLMAVAKTPLSLHLAGHVLTLTHHDLMRVLNYSGQPTGSGIAVNLTPLQPKIVAFTSRVQTAGRAFHFKTHSGKLITVPAGIYGWQANLSQFYSQLTARLHDTDPDQSTSLTIPHVGPGYSTKKTANGIGNTYVEISKAAQYEWVYRQGHVILSSPVVTGKPGQDTPSGVFDIWSKQRNAVLRGQNDDGSAYASPVAYWMPIDNTGVGLHDAPWQPTFGGDWYKSHGSHGCVNQPPAFAARLYHAVTVGEPVVVY